MQVFQGSFGLPRSGRLHALLGMRAPIPACRQQHAVLRRGAVLMSLACRAGYGQLLPLGIRPCASHQHHIPSTWQVMVTLSPQHPNCS